MCKKNNTDPFMKNKLFTEIQKEIFKNKKIPNKFALEKEKEDLPTKKTNDFTSENIYSKYQMNTDNSEVLKPKPFLPQIEEKYNKTKYESKEKKSFNPFLPDKKQDNKFLPSMQNYLDQSSIKKEEKKSSVLQYIPEARGISSILNEKNQSYNYSKLTPEEKLNPSLIPEKRTESKVSYSNANQYSFKNEPSTSGGKYQHNPETSSIVNNEQIKNFNYSKNYSFANKQSKIPEPNQSLINKPSNLQNNNNYSEPQSIINDPTKSFNYSGVNMQKNRLEPEKNVIKNNVSNINAKKSEIVDLKTQKELDELIALRYYQEEMEAQAKMDEETAKVLYLEQEEGINESVINKIQKSELENQLAIDEYLAHEYKGFFN